MRNFELEKLKFEREQLKLALEKAIDELNRPEIKKIISTLKMDPAELKELQSKTSQLPNLYKKDPDKYATAKALAEEINQRVSETRHDKSDEQQGFLSVPLVHTIPGVLGKDLNSDIDEVR
jgi:DNA repair ATPase RecN